MSKRRAYNKDTAIEIKRMLDDGMAIDAISKKDGMPSNHCIKKWIDNNRYGVFSDEPEIMPKATGAPTKYTEELAIEILTRVMENESLRSIAKDDHMPSVATIMRWRIENHEGFGEDYDMAFKARMLYAAEEILDIADDGTNDYVEKQTKNGEIVVLDSEHISRSKLRVDTRKWLLSKLVANYNDKHALDVTSSDGSMSPSGAPTSFDINFIEGKSPEESDED